MKVIDLFCGCGGLSLGFQMAGHQVVFGLDTNRDALLSFSKNFPNSTICSEDITKIPLDQIPDADIIVGGPPCVNFSTSKGKRANVLEGLRLVQTFLRIVYEKKPKYWIMENVPRVGLHLPEKIPLRWIGVNRSGFLDVPNKIEFLSSDFGAPQNRKRLLLGNYPIPTPRMVKQLTLRDVVLSLSNKDEVRDINYGETLCSSDVSDHDKYYLTPIEVARIKKAKTEHPYMGFMPFPDELDKPARTVVALQMGRETLVIKEGSRFRRATVRECATIQTFPISFQFYGNTVASRMKQVGNAVPPILSYNIAKSIPSKMKLDSAYIYRGDLSPKANPIKAKPFKPQTQKNFVIQFPKKIVRGFRVEIVTSAVGTINLRVVEGEGKSSRTVLGSTALEYFSKLFEFYNLSDITLGINDAVNHISLPSIHEFHVQLHEDPISDPPILTDLKKIFSAIPQNDKIKKFTHLADAPFKKSTVRFDSAMACLIAGIFVKRMNMAGLS